MTDLNILVRSPNWIGDQILSYLFFYYLRKGFPKAHIAAVCIPWVQDLQFQNLVDEVHVLPRAQEASLLDRLRVLETSAAGIRKSREWDLGFSLPNSISSACLLYRSGVRTRIGYSGDGRGWLLNSRVKLTPSSTKHRTQDYVNLLPREVQPTWGGEGFLVAANQELQYFNPATAWPNSKPLTPPTEPYWVIAPGSAAESRRWPVENFVALARNIAEATGWIGIVVGGKEEAQTATQLCEDRILNLEDWTSRGTVSSLAQLFRDARLTVSNDSGLAHVAALCGSTVYVVWGGGNPERTRPLGPGRVQIIHNPVDCWPCERNICRQPPAMHLKCLKGIFADRVWNQMHLQEAQKA